MRTEIEERPGAAKKAEPKPELEGKQVTVSFAGRSYRGEMRDASKEGFMLAFRDERKAALEGVIYFSWDSAEVSEAGRYEAPKAAAEFAPREARG